MAVSRHVRAWHRRLSVVVGLQLLLWTTSGLVFTWVPIEEVRGETALADRRPPPPVDVRTLVSLAAALETAGPGSRADDARLAWRRGRWTWVLPADGGPRLVDAASGELLVEVAAQEAAELAASALSVPADVGEVVRLETAAGEYRDKPVPAWRVAFDDDERTNVYIDAREGTVTSVRTDTWRRFDWFWMLHIMDYRERTDFGTPWLTAVAALGVATSVSGLWLAGLVLLGRRRAGAS